MSIIGFHCFCEYEFVALLQATHLLALVPMPSSRQLTCNSSSNPECPQGWRVLWVEEAGMVVGVGTADSHNSSSLDTASRSRAVVTETPWESGNQEGNENLRHYSNTAFVSECEIIKVPGSRYY